MTFLMILGVNENVMQFQVSVRRETGKEIPKSSRLEFLEKFLANNLALQMWKAAPPSGR